MRKIFIEIIVIGFLLSSCSKSGGTLGTGSGTTTNCASTPKAFGLNVNPIIQSFCNIAGCHNSGSFNGPGALTNYTQLFDARISIRAAVSSGFMPQNTTLTTAQKNSIICWIDDGAQNN